MSYPESTTAAACYVHSGNYTASTKREYKKCNCTLVSAIVALLAARLPSYVRFERRHSLAFRLRSHHHGFVSNGSIDVAYK